MTGQMVDHKASKLSSLTSGLGLSTDIDDWNRENDEETDKLIESHESVYDEYSDTCIVESGHIPTAPPAPDISSVAPVLSTVPTSTTPIYIVGSNNAPSDWYSSRSYGFIHGFILGQFIVIFVTVIFVRFFMFSNSPPKSWKPKSTSATEKEDRENDKRVKKPVSGTNLVSTEDSNGHLVLEKIGYSLNSHATESLDWFNVILASIINYYRDMARQEDHILDILHDILNREPTPDFLDHIKVTEVNIGHDFPILSSCGIGLTSDSNIPHAEFDIDLSDTLTIGIETRLLLRERWILNSSLPISLTVSIVRFSARMSLSVIKADHSVSKQKQVIAKLSFSKDFTLEIAIKSLLGSRSRLYDTPRLSYFVEGRIRKWLTDKCMTPNSISIVIANLWQDEEETAS